MIEESCPTEAQLLTWKLRKRENKDQIQHIALKQDTQNGIKCIVSHVLGFFFKFDENATQNEFTWNCITDCIVINPARLFLHQSAAVRRDTKGELMWVVHTRITSPFSCLVWSWETRRRRGCDTGVWQTDTQSQTCKIMWITASAHGKVQDLETTSLYYTGKTMPHRNKKEI